MKHKASLGLFEYWNRCRGDQQVPLRGEIEPAHLQTVLPNVFVLDCGRDEIVFRLAGTAVCSLFGRELRDSRMQELWLSGQVGAAVNILANVRQQGAPATIGARAESKSGRSIDLEILLLPLASAPGRVDRILGTLNTLSKPYWLHIDPIVGLQTISARMLDPRRESAFHDRHDDTIACEPTVIYRSRRSGSDIRRLCSLTVIEGGRRG